MYGSVILMLWYLIETGIGQQGSPASPMSTMRLVRHPYNEYLVEIKYLDRWRPIFISQYDPSPIKNGGSIARVICRQVGRGEPSYLTVVSSGSIGFEHTPAFQIQSCTGSESSIQDCHHFTLSEHEKQTISNDYLYYGRESLYVGVICNATAAEAPSYRLIGGESPSEGMVEVLFKGERALVCIDPFGNGNAFAKMICDKMGYSNGTSYLMAPFPRYEPYVHPNNISAWLQVWHCNDYADSWEDCEYSAWWRNESCLYSKSWLTVMCQGPESPLPVRLVGGSSPTDGRVEVLLLDMWIDVCVQTGSEVSNIYSEIVCRQLGYTNGSSYLLLYNRFFQDPTDYREYWEGILMLETHATTCGENSQGLDRCQTRAWGGDDHCGSYINSEYLAVICSVEKQIPLRLVGGGHPSAGLVQMQFHGEWGNVCAQIDNPISYEDHGKVICRQLGYHTETSHSYMVSPQLFGTALGADVERVWMTVGKCDANENWIQNCESANLWGTSSCSTLLAVVCNDSAPVPRPIRLVGSPLPSTGRLEILGFNGEWARVCSSSKDILGHWNRKSADLACRQLGFTKWSHHLIPGSFGKGSGPILLTGVECNGTESDLESCAHYMWGYYKDLVWNLDADSFSDITLACDIASPISLRLVGGSAPSEGILQVHFNGLPGNICNKSWDHNDTLVACRQLGFTDGFSYAAPSQMFNNKVTKAGRLWLEDIRCTGEEVDIQDCPHSTWGEQIDENCKEAAEAEVAIVCDDPIPEIRLVGGKTSDEGVVQVKFRGEWITLCFESEGGLKWTDSEAKVVCRQLGYDGRAFAVAARLFQGGLWDLSDFHSEEAQSLWLKNLRCNGDEEALGQCQHVPWIELCSSEQDYRGFAGVICVEDRSRDSPATSTPAASVLDITDRNADGISKGLASSPNMMPMATILLVLVVIIGVLIVVVIALLAMMLINRRKYSYIPTGQPDADNDGDEDDYPPGESKL